MLARLMATDRVFIKARKQQPGVCAHPTSGSAE
jgi:hypothetical protein